MANEEETKAVWPDDAVKIDKPSRDTPIMTVDARTKRMAKVEFGALVDSAREQLEISTIETEPLSGGKYVEYPTVLVDGPAGQNRTTRLTPGFFDLNGEVVELEKYFDWRYWWNGSEGKIVNMGELPVAPVTDDLTSTSTTDALSANQGRVLNEGKVNKEANKSLVLDTLITKLSSLYTKQQIDELFTAVAQSISEVEEAKVDKVSGSSLVTNVLIQKLQEDFTHDEIVDLFSETNQEVDSVAQGLSSLGSNVDALSQEVSGLKNTIKTSGDGKSYLSDDGTYKKVQGGGFYNVTVQHPLESGYYNLATASSVIKSEQVFDSANEVKGLIITFQSAEGWIDYRYTGATLEDLDNLEKWEEYADNTSVKGVRMNGDLLPKDSQGVVDLEVSVEVDQTIDPNSTNAVASAAVAAEFAGLASKYIVALQLNEIGEDEDKVFSISGLDEDGNVLTTTAEFSGGGGGGSVSTTKIVLSKVTENPTVKQGDDVVLEYYYDHRDTATDTSTGLPAKVTISIVSGATSQTQEVTMPADTYSRINVTKYLQVGVNTVRVRAEVDTGGDSPQVMTVSWRVQVVTLRLTSSLDFALLHARGTTINVPYNLTGSGAKSLKLYVDGVQSDEKSITTSSSNGSFVVSTASMSHGSHSIQLVAELEVSSAVTLLSNSIYFDVAVTVTGITTPIVTTRFDYSDGTVVGAGQRPLLKARQFEEYAIRYAGYNPSQGQDTIQVEVAGQTIASIVSAFVQRSVTSRTVNSGSYAGRILIAGIVYTFGVEIAESDMDFDEPTDNLVLKLTAVGRTNSDTGRDTWTYNGITTTFTGVQYAGDGWVNNALRLMNGGQAVINYEPLNLANASARLNAFAFQCKLKISDVTDNTKRLLSCISGGVGFEITSEQARMVSSGNREVLMKFSAGREYNIAFVSMPVADPGTSSEFEIANSSMLYLFIDGILSGIALKGEGDNIYQTGTPAKITLKGDSATLDVQSIRCYNNYLTPDQVLDIYMLDLNSVDEIITKYEFNKVIDSEGDVTVDSLPAGSRYVIVTGAQANGMSTVKYAAAINNKDTRYDVDEILHIVKGGDPSLNFLCKGGCIRLQGTSSLAYPIKNYRIYFRSATSSSVFGQVFVGVNEQGIGGTLIPDAKPKWSFRLANAATGKRPAPVNVWCLKADFAESSSSHNTGMVRMANDTFVKSGSPTPAQKHVASSHPYDVRTTIDGEPCFMFARNTITDKPVFIGKYNFNNDKSTEEVFGFLDIPGYHDAPWVDSVFGGVNPTECWEFLNNDFPMGSYKEDDFDALNEDGSPAWNRVFEARFPDVQGDYDDGTLGKPTHLERWVKWVKSTDGNGTKFKNELALYADVNHLCKYFITTQLLGAVDQMVKNAMLGFWYDPDVNRMLAYYIFYDGDTILGVRNDGRLKYSWDITRQTLDPELTASAGKNIYAFMGHESVLWNNLEAQFADELGVAYRSLRTQLTNDGLFNYFDRDQTNKFPERIYNLDAQFKYIEPATLGVTIINNGTEVNTKYSFMEAGQGSRASHRRWWLENRLDLYDARYSTGQYTLTDITWKGISDVGAKVRAIMSRDYYVEFRREGTVMSRGFVANGAEWSYTYNQTANVGTIFHFLGGKYFKVLDLSEWGGFTDLTIPVLQSLEHLILGRTSRTYTLSELAIGTKLPMLKILDITNYTVLPGLDLSGCVKLEQVIAVGCTNLGTLRLPQGAPMTVLRLASGLTTLSLIGLPYLQNSGIIFPSGNNIRNLIVDSCPNVNWQSLTSTLGGVQNIRVTGIDMSGSVSILDQYKNLGGIDSNGNVVSGARLIGTFRLTNYLSDVIYAEYRLAFPELNLVQPSYSTYKIYLDVSTPRSIYNMDNGTGYDPELIIQNKPFAVSGHIKSVHDRIHRYLGKHTSQGVQSIIQLSDSDSTKFSDGTSADLGGSQGDVFTKIPKYWFKGINDIRNNNIYVCVSSDINKPANSSDIKVFNQVAQLAEVQSQSYVSFSDSAAVVVKASHSKMTYARVPVSGYVKARFPLMPNLPVSSSIDGGLQYSNVCAVFTDSNGSVISRVQADYTKFGYDGYIIVDIPSGASELHTSFNTSVGFSKIVLSKTTIITDLEDEWVERSEMLIGSFLISKDTLDRPRSKTELSPSLYTPRYTPSSAIRDALQSRALTAPGYTEYKDLMWLVLLKYGTFNVFEKLGRGSTWRSHTTPYGLSSPMGIKETSFNGSYDSGAPSDGHMSVLGIENLWGGGFRGTITDLTSDKIYNSTFPSYIQLRNNRKLFYTPTHSHYTIALPHPSSVLNRFISGGLHLDLMPTGTTGGSTTTYLCHTHRNSIFIQGQENNVDAPFTLFADGALALSGGARFDFGIWANADGDNNFTRERIMWPLNLSITEVTNSTVFKNLTMIG